MCRAEGLVEEVNSMPLELHRGRPDWLDDQGWPPLDARPPASKPLSSYQAPLRARVYLRLGTWRWTMTSSEVKPDPCVACRILAAHPQLRSMP